MKPQPFRYGKLIESEDVVAKPESWRGGVQPRFNAGSRLAVVFVYCVVFLNTSIETHAVPCLTHTCRHAQWQTKVVRDTGGGDSNESGPRKGCCCLGPIIIAQRQFTSLELVGCID